MLRTVARGGASRNQGCRSGDHGMLLWPAPADRSLGWVMTLSSIPDVGDIEMINGTRAVLDMLAGKWCVEILYLLATGTRRYSEVLYEVGEISKKTLTQTLRSLEHDGLVARRVTLDAPGRVEYSLTPLGWSITEPLVAMYEWAAEHLPGPRRHGELLAA
jgi:DNA-binding HxlR family transcriptional regulator